MDVLSTRANLTTMRLAFLVALITMLATVSHAIGSSESAAAARSAASSESVSTTTMTGQKIGIPRRAMRRVMRGPSDQTSVSPSETPALRPNSASALPAGDRQPSPLPSASASESARTADSPYAIVPNSTVSTRSAYATRFSPLKPRLGKFQHQQQRRELQGATDIANQGGPILANPKVYLIYYGNWPEGSGQDVIENFINSLGGDTGNQGDPTGENSVRNWWDISTNYYQNNDDGTQTFVSPDITLGGTVTDDGSNGWQSIDLGTIVNTHAGTDLPIDTDGIYLVLTSSDVQVDGFCDSFCGFHTQTTLDSGENVAVGFIGSHDNCCTYSDVSPNGMPGIDSMISTIGHEIAEAATDPDVSSGWMAADGEENADMCAWQYGDVSQDTDGNGNTYDYNMVGNDGMRFMVEANFDLITNSCQIQAQNGG
ncbi:unnamed protein product [Closterium sp. Yama58-4]|nr:unnamed protein product [Closterium sp. Yama58-4]